METSVIDGLAPYEFTPEQAAAGTGPIRWPDGVPLDPRTTSLRGLLINAKPHALQLHNASRGHIDQVKGGKISGPANIKLAHAANVEAGHANIRLAHLARTNMFKELRKLDPEAAAAVHLTAKELASKGETYPWGDLAALVRDARGGALGLPAVAPASSGVAAPSAVASASFGAAAPPPSAAAAVESAAPMIISRATAKRSRPLLRAPIGAASSAPQLPQPVWAAGAGAAAAPGAVSAMEVDVIDLT
ncbi:hypothetical protein Rsub_03026 [Raphidocelis subcapitata]|uniref:Uncharacterized protein n=1 Tax=Raphidocelis subcapitata TaxID=307507 RepID=A0A2V0P0V8_9CHLO|nr:hypothetical protein Rsub_03026 [Raphidocelis subcapitata]|eukprot:GBF90725.1 hypothetical protein Rsub_03026 [Raphidocelis subcapitata]